MSVPFANKHKSHILLTLIISEAYVQVASTYVQCTEELL